MNAGRTLRWARRRARLTQRDLARATGIAQPTIARIESGCTVPRLDTLQRLLAVTGHRILVDGSAGVGVDRTLIADLLRRSPRARLASLGDEARFLGRLDSARRIEAHR